MNKRQLRKRRAAKTKLRIKEKKLPKLVVFRSNSHIYVQLVEASDNGDLVKASASTVDKEIAKNLSGNKTEQALLVGKLLAKRAKDAGIQKVAFDRSGYKYHGRVKALADGAREEGLEF